MCYRAPSPTCVHRRADDEAIRDGRDGERHADPRRRVLVIFDEEEQTRREVEEEDDGAEEKEAEGAREDEAECFYDKPRARVNNSQTERREK